MSTAISKKTAAKYFIFSRFAKIKLRLIQLLCVQHLLYCILFHFYLLKLVNIKLSKQVHTRRANNITLQFGQLDSINKSDMLLLNTNVN